MKNVLIVSNNKENIALFEKYFGEDFFKLNASSPENANMIANDMTFDIVIIEGFSPDSLKTRAETVISTVESEGAFFLPEISDKMLSALVSWIRASQIKSEKLIEKNSVLQKKIEDISIIARAKIILVKTLGTTENEAHKYIEKKAMEMRVTKSEVAKRIILTYEN